MKTITSAGGPYIIIDQDRVPSWGAYERKSFSPLSSSFPNDYEAAGDLTDGVSHPPCNIAKFIGNQAEALLITMPFEISIVDRSLSCTYIAQVHFADPEWSFSEVSLASFSHAKYNENIVFTSKGATYKLFDSAYLPDEIDEDCLGFELVAGDYAFSAAIYQPDERTGLYLYKIALME
ncbi:MAG: hypothetical protein INR62_11250 [Rhodospirillales bacterium]|nr:hypothetical protein [Acetobacter sp.]